MAGVPKLKGKSKERIKLEQKTEIKREVLLIERLGIAAVSERDTALLFVQNLLS
jgi:hypothetical protein